MMTHLNMMDFLSMALILSSEMMTSACSPGFPMPLGTFMTFSRSHLLESQHFLNNRFMAPMFLVIRPESFTDQDCLGIHALLSYFADYVQVGSKKCKHLLGDGWNGHGKGKWKADWLCPSMAFIYPFLLPLTLHLNMWIWLVDLTTHKYVQAHKCIQVNYYPILLFPVPTTTWDYSDNCSFESSQHGLSSM